MQQYQHTKSRSKKQNLKKILFGIVIFTPFFNPVLTAEARQQFLQKCTGAMMNEEWVNAIIATYGSLMTDPDPS